MLSLYWNRYLRLTALLGVLVLEAISLQQFYGNGPIWPIQIQNYINRCERNWWSTLLFIGNYVHTEDMVCKLRQEVEENCENSFVFALLLKCRNSEDRNINIVTTLAAEEVS